MKKAKNKILIVLGLFMLMISTVGVTYAFFEYSRTSNDNIIKAGRISFNATENSTIVLNNVFPTTSSSDSTNAKSMTITVTGDTDYEDGLEYAVILDEVNLTIGSGTNVKPLPVKLEVSVTGNGLGTAETGDYYDNHTGYSTTSKYKVVYDNTRIKDESRLVVGYIAPNTTPGTASGINGTITLKAYVDGSKVIISDSTTPETTVTIDGEVYTNNTEIPQDAIVLTTDEWNAITGSGALSFKIRVEAKEGIWLEKKYICRRVTNAADLHKEQCTNSSTTEYCQADVYALNDDVTYGNAKALGSALATGDAFDCDVNGNGVIDRTNGISTERFYYVSDYWNQGTNINDFDTDTAVLIYYSNVTNGVASYSGYAYATQAAATSLGYTCTQTSGCNNYGPLTVSTHLPTISQWSNVDLKTTTRKIMACNNQNCSNTPVETTTMGTIMNPYYYGGKAARLLTIPELVKGCKGTINGNISLATDGSLTACNFLFEGTKYADSSRTAYGSWLEMPYTTTYAWNYGSGIRRVTTNSPYTSTRGARPVIEVPYSKLLY